MNAVLESWPRTALIAILLLALFTVVVVLVSLAQPLRHTSFPGHPYPPPGFTVNPFSSDKDDLISVSEAARVKADLLADGDAEVEAFARDDRSVLERADTGNRLALLRRLLEENSQAGIVQQERDSRDRIVVGRLADPREPSVTWCVEENGTSTVIDIAKSSLVQLRTRSYRFEGRFWLTRMGDRYLIADAEITNRPLTNR